MPHFTLIAALLLVLLGAANVSYPAPESASAQEESIALAQPESLMPLPAPTPQALSIWEERAPALPAHTLPFYSQFADISSSKWQKIGCGIASLAMIIEYHKPNSIASVDALLAEGIAKDAYLASAGWTYKGLIDVSSKYGFDGESYDLAGMDGSRALAELERAVEKGPVIASVHYTFDPANPIPHLVVVNGIEGDTVFYNDPAEKAGGGSISTSKFLKAWKKRYIEFYPVS